MLIATLEKYRLYIFLLLITFLYFQVSKIHIHTIISKQIQTYTKKKKHEWVLSYKQLFYFYVYPVAILFVLDGVLNFNKEYFKDVFTYFALFLTVLVTFFSLGASLNENKKLIYDEININISYTLLLSLVIIFVSGITLLFDEYKWTGYVITYLIIHLILNFLMIFKRVFLHLTK